jgi:hypothetical protein
MTMMRFAWNLWESHSLVVLVTGLSSHRETIPIVIGQSPRGYLRNSENDAKGCNAAAV